MGGGYYSRPITIMTNTEIRRANVATLRKEAKSRGIDTNGMNRSMLVDALLDMPITVEDENPELPEEIQDSPIKTVKLVPMVSPSGLEANVHPDMVEDYKIGGYTEV